MLCGELPEQNYILKNYTKFYVPPHDDLKIDIALSPPHSPDRHHGASRSETFSFREYFIRYNVRRSSK